MKAFAQTLGLHPGVAIVVFALDMMLFGADITGVGWLLSCAVAAVLTVPAFLMQRNAYGDEWQVALAKALMVGLLTAIPTPLPGFLTATAGVVGIGGKLLGCGRRRALPPSVPELTVTPRICCPACGKQGQWQSHFEGREVICPRCKSQFAARVEGLDSSASSPHRPWVIGKTFALAGGLVAAVALPALTEALRPKPPEPIRAAVTAAQPGVVVKQLELGYAFAPPSEESRTDGVSAQASQSPTLDDAALARLREALILNYRVCGTMAEDDLRRELEALESLRNPPVTVTFDAPPLPILPRAAAEAPPVLVAPPVESEGLDEERASRAMLKILAAAGVEVLGREAEQSIDENLRWLFGPMVREVKKIPRDELVALALQDVFPELPRRAIRIIGTIIGQILDGKITLSGTAWPLAQDEVIEILRRYDADLADMTKVSLFIHRIAMAK